MTAGVERKGELNQRRQRAKRSKSKGDRPIQCWHDLLVNDDAHVIWGHIARRCDWKRYTARATVALPQNGEKK
eukprot:2728281-Pyramimonas_sp.AAC.1